MVDREVKRDEERLGERKRGRETKDGWWCTERDEKVEEKEREKERQIGRGIGRDRKISGGEGGGQR